MTTLYDRRCVLLVGPPPPDNYVLTVPDALKISGLRVAFKVTRTLEAKPNTAEIAVWNLSASSRGLLKGTGFRVVLSAGYAESVAQLFSGDTREFRHAHQAPDWVTKFEAGDGERAFAHARVSQSWRPGVDARQVVAHTVKALQLDPTNALARAQAIAGQFSAGYVAHAKASTELTRLLQPHGLSWSIQDGRVEILGPGESVAEEGPFLSPATGLVGSPEVGAPEKKGGRPLLKVRSLLSPGLRPGQGFTLETRGLSGRFVARRVVHSGDTAGGDWYTEIEAET